MVITYTSGRRGPYEVTCGALCVLVGVSVYMLVIHISMDQTYTLCVRLHRVHACVWLCAFSPMCGELISRMMQ